MEADVIVRAKVKGLGDDFDPQVLAEEIKNKVSVLLGFALRQSEVEIGSVMVIGDDGRDGEV